MKTQDFIESGILESQLLGLTSKEEKEQVRLMMLADRSLENYVIDLEADIRKYFTSESVSPPTAVRELIELKSFKEKHNFNSDNRTGRTQYLDVEVNDTHIKVHKFWRPAFIAVFVLSKIFLIAGLYYYFKSASQQEELLRLKTQIEQVNR
ncbi:hypothetical protein [Dyadobacter arcticus]|uniref:Anti-sigma factor n=1 Tax=Dyadobacter arcticus TaxID=1078754 RepID=A0ABX0UNF8_9BACT|nr:hypothetical protein [Dyadobacter arcticus]NIJ53514.1 hypothetical protein [Dyadobacter arcticus]